MLTHVLHYFGFGPSFGSGESTYVLYRGVIAPPTPPTPKNSILDDSICLAEKKVPLHCFFLSVLSPPTGLESELQPVVSFTMGPFGLECS